MIVNDLGVRAFAPKQNLRACVAPMALRLCLLACVLTLPAYAQAPSAPTARESAERQDVLVYNAKDFEQYRPVSLQDILDRIPGLSNGFTRTTEERRGLRGNEDTFLINGKQISGKDNRSFGTLVRIPATQVERIEVVRGNVGELEATSKRIINIVLRVDGVGVFTHNTGLAIYRDSSVRPALLYAYSFTQPNLNYSVSLQSDPRYRPWQRTEITSNANGRPVLDVRDFEQATVQTTTLKSTLDNTFLSGAQLQLNALLQYIYNDREKRENGFDITRSPQRTAISDRLEDDHRDRGIGEVSADYQFPVNTDDKFTAVALYNYDKEQKKRGVRDIFAAANRETLREKRDDLKTESVLRGTYTWAAAEGQSVDTGVEGVVNTQRTKFDLQVLAGGRFVPVPIFNSNSKIIEYRAEPFLTHRWSVSESWQLETSLASEVSRLKQSGDVQSRRSLFYIKPAFNAFYTPNDGNKLFGSIRRDVSQLNFLEFIATISADEAELDAGNPDLLPEKSWDYELGWEHRLSAERGVITLRGFYRDVQDVSELVSFNGFISQPGNIGNGTEWGGEAEVSLQLSKLGLWNGVLTSSFLMRDTSVTDPFIKRKRVFSDKPKYEWNLNYKHDISFIRSTLGVQFTKNGRQTNFDLDETERLSEVGNMTLTLDYRYSQALAFNITMGNALNRRTTKDRTGFLVNAIDGRVGRLERETQTWGRWIGLNIRGTF